MVIVHPGYLTQPTEKTVPCSHISQRLRKECSHFARRYNARFEIRTLKYTHVPYRCAQTLGPINRNHIRILDTPYELVIGIS